MKLLPNDNIISAANALNRCASIGITTAEAVRNLGRAMATEMKKIKVICTYISDFGIKVDEREVLTVPSPEQVSYEGWIVSKDSSVILLAMRVDHAKRLYCDIVVIPTNCIVNRKEVYAGL